MVAGSLESADADGRAVHCGVRRGLRTIELRRDDVYFEEWWKMWHPGVGAAFAALLEAERPDLVHVHHWFRLTTDLVRIARRFGASTVVTAHDHFSVLGRAARLVSDVEARHSGARFGWLGAEELDRSFAFLRDDLADDLRAADLRIAPSQAHAESLAELAPFDVGRFDIVPPPAGPLPARVADWDGAIPRRVLIWGGWTPEKGLATVLEAVARCRAHFEIDVLGEVFDERERVCLQQRAASHPVRFHGAFEGADALVRAAQGGCYAVLPTHCRESFGLTLDEALALGIPVLASDIPAFRERDPGDGSVVFFDAGEPDALCRLLEQVDRSPPPRPPAVAAAASTTSIAASVENLYQHARRRPAPQPPRLGDGARAERLWQVAERRMWSLLQRSDAPPPPDDYL